MRTVFFLVFASLPSLSPRWPKRITAFLNASASYTSANSVIQFEQRVGRYERPHNRGHFNMTYLQGELEGSSTVFP